MDALTPTLALQGWAAACAVAVLTWCVSLWRRDASLADRVWGVLVALPLGWGAWRLGVHASPSVRDLVLLALVAAWALRLTLYITWRNRGHGEDRRYAAMRREHGRAFALRSLFTVFLLQATIAVAVAAPALAALTSQAPWGGLDTLGLLLAAAGLGIETAADAQLARFRNRPRPPGAVLDRGLWRWSRHPNYFGEACVWWGVGLMALGAGVPAWLMLSPALMTFLLLRVSGVRLLERDLAERRPAYRAYMARTSAFVPWPPRPAKERR